MALRLIMALHRALDMLLLNNCMGLLVVTKKKAHLYLILHISFIYYLFLSVKLFISGVGVVDTSVSFILFILLHI